TETERVLVFAYDAKEWGFYRNVKWGRPKYAGVTQVSFTCLESMLKRWSNRSKLFLLSGVDNARPMTRLLIRDITDHLETLAPLSYQEHYDNAGLLTGSPAQEVTGVLITLDCTEAVVEEAIE